MTNYGEASEKSTILSLSNKHQSGKKDDKILNIKLERATSTTDTQNSNTIKEVKNSSHNKSSQADVGYTLFVLGIVVLLIQNFLIIFFSPFLLFESLIFLDLKFLLFIDIFGFLCLSVSYFIKSNKRKNTKLINLNTLTAGFIILFVISKLVWVFSPDFSTFLITYHNITTNDYRIWFLFISSIFLLLATVTKYLSAVPGRNFFLIYGILNFIGAGFIFFHNVTNGVYLKPIGESEGTRSDIVGAVWIKFIIVPLFAFFFFYYLFNIREEHWKREV